MSLNAGSSGSSSVAKRPRFMMSSKNASTASSPSPNCPRILFIRIRPNLVFHFAVLVFQCTGVNKVEGYVIVVSLYTFTFQVVYQLHTMVLRYIES